MKALRNVLIVLLAILVVGGLISYVVLRTMSGRNSAQPVAEVAMTPDGSVVVTGGDPFVFRPSGNSATTGFIIYPGGLVDPMAYAPLARAIAEQGYLVLLDQAPLDLSVIDAGAAADMVNAYPEITTWAIGGHSLGGAMAADFVAKNPGVMEGLALWAAYPPNGSDLSGSTITALSVWGSNDGLTTIDDIEDSKQRLPSDTTFIEIVGGNHTQFGYYGVGLQRGDNPATISVDEQQQQIFEATVEMLEAISSGSAP